MAEAPPQVLVDEEEGYEAERILQHKSDGAQHRYLVLWKGYPLTEATEDPESYLTNAPLILKKYLCNVTTTKKPR